MSAARRSIAVRISGNEYRIRSDADEDALQRVARYVDETMERIRTRTGAVDSLEIALLTALNIARELVELRGERAAAPPPEALRALIERVEAAVPSSGAPR
ncbi:MAG: cell division protein ZapA [Myxococcota bacterium]